MLIFTTAGDAFSMMSANEFESWVTRCVFVSARAVTYTGALLCVATASAAIRPPPIEAASSVRMAVERRNWITFDISSRILSYWRLVLNRCRIPYIGRIKLNFDAWFHLNRRCFYPVAGFDVEREARTRRICVNPHGLASSHLPCQNALGERSFNLTLDGALQGSRSVVRIEPTPHQTRTGCIR